MGVAAKTAVGTRTRAETMSSMSSFLFFTSVAARRARQGVATRSGAKAETRLFSARVSSSSRILSFSFSFASRLELGDAEGNDVIASRASRVDDSGGADAIAIATVEDQASERTPPSDSGSTRVSVSASVLAAFPSPFLTAKISSAAEARNSPLRSRTRLEATNAPFATIESIESTFFPLSSTVTGEEVSARRRSSASDLEAPAPSDAVATCAAAEMCVVSSIALGSHITERVAGNSNAPTPPSPVGYPNPKDETPRRAPESDGSFDDVG
jgi:hypothetical protein